MDMRYKEDNFFEVVDWLLKSAISNQNLGFYVTQISALYIQLHLVKYFKKGDSFVMDK